MESKAESTLDPIPEVDANTWVVNDDQAKYLLLVERDLNFFRLCIANVVKTQQEIAAIQQEVMSCRACGLHIATSLDPNKQPGQALCTNHGNRAAQTERAWEATMMQCFRAVEGRDGEALDAYMRHCVEAGKRAHELLGRIAEAEAAEQTQEANE